MIWALIWSMTALAIYAMAAIAEMKWLCIICLCISGISDYIAANKYEQLLNRISKLERESEGEG